MSNVSYLEVACLATLSFKFNGETSSALCLFSLLKISTGVITAVWLHAMLSSNASLYKDVTVKEFFHLLHTASIRISHLVVLTHLQ